MNSAPAIRSLQGDVAVLLGGNSAERAISLKSGNAVLESLHRQGVKAIAIDTAQPGWLRGMPDSVRHVFIALHGPGGEDGTVQGALELLGLSYTGSGVLASALAMDKLRSKQLWTGIGLPTPEFARLDAGTDYADLIARWSTVIVKPSHEGSSLGMARVSSVEDLAAAHAEAARFDSVVLAERCIRGAEFTVAILGREALPAIRLETDRAFYDYEAKYVASGTRYICPCGLDPAQERRLRDLCLAAFDSLGCRGWGRVDVMQDATSGEFFLLEVNTIPGMTDHSLVPMAAVAAGMDFDALVKSILQQSLPGGAA